ncbi:MAG: hypothetical protein SWH54_17225 [Thermodesulfobacteriota bacterium]|nr:hypothetical protein [Thermodesulfobacteriota bacterium]
MYKKLEEREYSRFKNIMPIVISDCNFEQYKEAKIYNSSSSGIYFESDVPIRPGTEICVKNNNATRFSGSDICHVKVIWCERIQDSHVFYRFGIGARYCFPDDYWRWISQAKFVRRNLKVIQGGKALGKLKRLKKWKN